MTQLAEFPGVRVQRRAVLCLPLAAAGAGILAPPARGAGAARGADEDAVGFEAFAAACEAFAADHLEGGGANPDAYLHRLAALGARLDADTAPLPGDDVPRWSTFDPPIRTRPVHPALPVMIIAWRLDPGAVLPPHNHTPGYVYSLCLEGEAWVRHFDVDGEAPAPGAEGDFRLRETHARLLRPGRGTSLTTERDNIHTFEAGPSGAAGIDINTFLPGDGDWSMIEARAAGDGYDRIWTARWTGKPA